MSLESLCFYFSYRVFLGNCQNQYAYERALKQAEAEVVPSSSLVEVEVEVGIEVRLGLRSR